MNEDGLQLFGGDWTERKLEALDRYLRAYAKVLSRQKFKRYYIDAFAGTGYREQPNDASLPDMFADELAEAEPQRFLDGSARIALKVTPAFHKYVFIERHAQRAAELEKLKQAFPQQATAISVVASDCNSFIRELCRNWDRRNWRGVLFLDPFGMQVEWATVEAVARTECIDVWILFPLAINRLLTQDPSDIPAGWRKRLDATFGDGGWEERFYQKRTEPDMFSGDRIIVEKAVTLESIGNYYRERLETVFPVVAKNPAVLRNTRNSPLFDLFFAAAAKGRGGEIAMKIAQHILTMI